MTAEEYAKSKGFDGARFLIVWNGMKCYEAETHTDDDSIPNIGFPQIVLEKNGSFRMADYDEALKIIRRLR